MSDALGTPGGVVSDEDHRLALAGLIAPATSTLAVRTGVMIAPGSTALVTGTSATGTMTYSIAAHHWVTTRGAGDGIYLGAKEAAGTVNTTAAPGSNSRIDLIYVKQNDSSSTIFPDGSIGELYGVVNGTAAASPVKPSLPVGATELATAVVAAGATSTNGAGVTITNTALQVSARGARVWVRSQAERDALTGYPGLEVYRLDTGMVERYPVSGTTWLKDPADWPICHAYQSTAQTGLASGWNSITLQSEAIDTHGMHAATGTFTVPTGQGGTYEGAGVLILPTVPAGTVVGVRALRAGVSADRYLGWFGAVSAGPANPALVIPPMVLAAGETVTLQGYVNVAGWSTSASNVGGSEFGSWMSLKRIR